MDTVPADLLAVMCDYLDHRSLRDISLVNRQFRSICIPLKFRLVELPFSSPQSLDLRVAECFDILRKSGSLKHVHHLKILPEQLYSLDIDASFARYHKDSARPLDPWKYCAVDESATELLTHDSQWQALADLIDSLAGLKGAHLGLYRTDACAYTRTLACNRASMSPPH